MSLIKVQVIDENLLSRNIDKKFNEDEFISQIPLTNTLNLSFSRLIKIENLYGFTKLQKLCLDNNQIEEIQNLSHLTELRWLDLSFNKISRLQGLDKLSLLEDLSLFNNNIQVVEGLQNCNKLMCLSIGNNEIDSFENILCLRSISSLRMLTLAGCPLSKQSDYKTRIFTYFKQLHYLDYRLITEQEKVDAMVSLGEVSKELESADAQKIAFNIAELKKVKKLDQLTSAGVRFTQSLAEELLPDPSNLDEDERKMKNEYVKVRSLYAIPEVNEIFNQFKQTLNQICYDYADQEISRSEVASSEIDRYEQSHQALEKEWKTTTQLISNGFEVSLESLQKTLQSSKGQIQFKAWKENIIHLNGDLEKICDELMSHELRLVEGADALLAQLEIALREQHQLSDEHRVDYFASVQTALVRLAERLQSLCTEICERAMREQYPEEVYGEEACTLLLHKDKCIAALSAAHESRARRVTAVEGVALESSRDTIEKVLSEERQKLLTRNRRHVLDVRLFTQRQKEILDQLDSFDEDEDLFAYSDSSL